MYLAKYPNNKTNIAEIQTIVGYKWITAVEIFLIKNKLYQDLLREQLTESRFISETKYLNPIATENPSSNVIS